VNAREETVKDPHGDKEVVDRQRPGKEEVERGPEVVTVGCQKWTNLLTAGHDLRSSFSSCSRF